MEVAVRPRHLVFSLVILLSTCFSTLIAIAQTSASNSKSCDASAGTVALTIQTGSLNINHLWLKVRNDGIVGYDSAKGHGLTYPLQYGGLLYADNLMWVGKVYDGQLSASFMPMPELRTGGGAYKAGVRPGGIIQKGIAENSESDAARVFRYRPDYLTADLTLDVASLKDIDKAAVTRAMVVAMRESYGKDLIEWPWQRGAPYVDKNCNRRMDPGEPPGLENASQVVWFSYNDLNESASKSFAGDIPIGFEVQVTLWAYSGIPNLDDVIFKRTRLIYKGTAVGLATSAIDSLYLKQWVDPDIGGGSNDLGGCDSVLGLAYAYNRTYQGSDQDTVYKTLKLSTPGLGYVLLQGPLVDGQSHDKAIFDFSVRQGKQNLPLSSCLVHMTGLADGLGVPTGVRDYFAWNTARGYSGQGSSLPHTRPYLDHEQRASKFMYYGDPASGSGWIASRPNHFWYDNSSLLNSSYAGGDVRLHMNMGPFSLALGDTQEIVVAMIASHAPTAAENVTWLRNRTKYVKAIYPNLGEYAASFVTGVPDAHNPPREFALYQNFPNPFNPSTQIKFSLPVAAPARLAIFDMLGREVRVLHDGSLDAGVHQVTWDGRSSIGIPVPSGVYFCRLVQEGRQLSQKLLLVR